MNNLLGRLSRRPLELNPDSEARRPPPPAIPHHAMTIGTDRAERYYAYEQLEAEAHRRAAHIRLVVLVGVVRELLHANQGLAGQSLSAVRTTIEALGGLLSQGASYGPDGERRSAHGQLVRSSA